MKIARITTIPEAFVHIRKQIQDLVKEGHEVTLITSYGDYQKILEQEANVKMINIEFAREIRPWQDLRTLMVLWWHFVTNRYDIVHSTTPKAGLLVAVASFFALVKVRLHTFTGQRWATLKGPKRKLLMGLDRLIQGLNSHCFADSPSQIDFLVEQEVVLRRNVSCLHKGCLGGIDFERFDANKTSYQRAEVLQEIELPLDSQVILFLGRMTEDKGIRELFESFKKLEPLFPKLQLLLIGSTEFESNETKQMFEQMSAQANVHYLGFQSVPEKFYAVADLFVMPSYREGFGTVILEAAAMKVPSIATRIPGLVDAVEDGVSGLLVSLKNTLELTAAIKKVLEDQQLLASLSENAYQRTKEHFTHQKISSELIQKYQEFTINP